MKYKVGDVVWVHDRMSTGIQHGLVPGPFKITDIEAYKPWNYYADSLIKDRSRRWCLMDEWIDHFVTAMYKGGPDETES